jgi:HNH endonuclease/AP2 domain
MAKKSEITHERSKRLFDYRPETGELVWRVNRNKARAGGVAGTIDAGTGYRRIGFDGRCYLAHRLVWLWHRGVWPAKHLDHISGDQADNRIENLREATASQNLANARKDKDNTSGYKGVYYEPATGKWRAQIMVEGKQIRLGKWHSAKAANIVYQRAASKYQGEFAAHKSKSLAERAERARIDALCDAMDIPKPPLTPECIAFEERVAARRAARLAVSP